MLLPFTALRRAFPRSVTCSDAHRAVALLVEMLADDRALRSRPARELVSALVRFGTAGPRPAPAGTYLIVGMEKGGQATFSMLTSQSSIRLRESTLSAVRSVAGLKGTVMPKMKTHRGAAKRFKKTGTGKIQRNHAFHSHILTKKSPGRKSALGSEVEVSKANEKTVSRMLPYL